MSHPVAFQIAGPFLALMSFLWFSVFVWDNLRAGLQEGKRRFFSLWKAVCL